MKTQTVNIYSFEELPADAKQKAINNFEYLDTWDSERRESYEAAKNIHNSIDATELEGVRLYKWVVNNILPGLTATQKYYKTKDGRVNKYYTTRRAQYSDAKIVRYSRIFSEVSPDNLTGYCSDYAFLEPLFDFLKNTVHKPRVNLRGILDAEAEQDRESFFEESNFAAMCAANNYEFYINGKLA